MVPLLLIALLAAAPDAGSFSDSALGRQRAGEVTALDSRWVEGLADVPLWAQVEKKGDALEIAFYARGAPESPSGEASRPDGGAPTFAEKARFAIPMARQLESLRQFDLGGAGPALAVSAAADDPDEQPVVLTLIGRGPRQLFQASLLRDANPPAAMLSLGPPEGFTVIADGGAASVNALSETKRVDVGFADGGKGQVSLGARARSWRWQTGKFVQAADGYHDFLVPLPVTAKGHTKLVDGKPTTAERVPLGTPIALRLPAGAKVRMVRLVPGCLESEVRSKREPQASGFTVQLDDTAPIPVTVGKPVSDPRLFGAGAFTLGKGYGQSEMLFFDPPVAASSLTVAVTAAEHDAKRGCVAELAVY